ncbi:hypothetical protein ABFW39_002860 [Listeria monocytogenes]|uniref:Uncharacterized protein n=1 Tax=Listeria farberi TaxID=2713500 RepID=A0A7X1DFX7_9LIST|nr:DUF5592 family protein [Listeria farberi]EAC2247073.1 hypothetical protein [Listeria monocytogenes]MBC1250569.1 hypothetical protein [Listeria welshimeri]EAC4362812.1 hypothetical protein [Listeria monocytogenes]EAD4958552.1 hypothetical protein [Listeria monocytogenes]EAF5380703.1 hypothetical protein [Listeria monocytogenes]
MEEQIVVIPQEIRATQKFFNLLSLRLLVVGMVYMLFVLYSDLVIPTPYRLFAWILTAVAAIFWLLPSATNPKKCNAQALWISLRRDKKTYLSIPQKRTIDMVIDLEQIE